MRRPAILFDLDGTLAHSGGGITSSLEALIAEQDLRIPVASLRAGMSLQDIFAQYAPEQDTLFLVRRFREIFDTVGMPKATLFEGVPRLLDDLREHARLAVVTSKGQEEAERTLEHLGIRDRFELVVGDDDRRPVKPHPAPLQYAVERLGLEAHEVLMVGDTEFDARAADAAAISFVGVGWGDGALQGEGIVENVDALWVRILQHLRP